MGKEEIVERILSDAKTEAESLIREAEEKAAKLQADAFARSEVRRKATEEEMAKKRESILDKRGAAARLDCSKLLLKEKRKVVDAVYDEALSRLLELKKEDSISLVENLLKAYAEAGDELYFANNYPYKKDVEILPVIKEKKLTVAEKYLPLDGGIWLKGKTSDKDLSFGALLNADRENNQALLAKELFK